MSDVVDAQGNRTVTWADGGYVTYKALNGRAATGIEALVTKDMFRQGSDPNPDITPPGWDPTKAWFRYGDLQRGHGLANVLGGTGLDGRNLFTVTYDANKAMRLIENQVRKAVIKNGSVQYRVDPVYDNGPSAAPTRIDVKASGGDLDIDEPIDNIP